MITMHVKGVLTLPPTLANSVAKKGKGATLDTGQIEQVIGNNILPVTADNTGRNGGLKT